MLRLFLIFSLSIAQIHGQEARNCIVCASIDLQNRWEMTGLSYIGDNYFDSLCNQAANNLKQESCSGQCMTMIFDDPDRSGNSLFVRGCHPTLTQTTSDRVAQPNYCEVDTSYPMVDRTGTSKQVRMLVEFCSSTGGCNKRPDFTSSPCDQQNSNLLNNAPISCYDCTPGPQGNCKENRCATKKYCMTRTVWVNGGRQISKSCSNVNIVGRDNACTSNDVGTRPGGVLVKNTVSQCFCKDKQYCNSVSRISSVLSAITVLIFTYC